jgi:drug/metabolite transporter (DMT)-like permease
MFKLMAGAIMISFSPVFVKLTTVEPTVSAFYRMFFGGLALAALVMIRREPVWFGGRALGIIAIAALFFAGDLFFWHRSILFVGPGLATLLANFQVFLLAVAGLWLFREPLRWEIAVSIPLAMVGLSLLVGLDWFSLTVDYRLGVGFGLLAALCYAAYILCLRASRASQVAPSSIAVIAPLSLYCALILAAAVALQGESFGIPSGRDAAVLLSYGIVAQVLGWVFISQGIARVRASQAGLILLLQPTLSFVWDVTLFGRQLTLLEGAGALLALTAIYLGSRQPRVSAVRK